MQQIQHNKQNGMTLDVAIREAIRCCIAHGIMKEFLEAHREEVITMVALQWDADEEKKVLRAEGVEEGKARVMQVWRLLQKKTPLTDIAEKTNASVDEVRQIAQGFGIAY